MASHPIYIADGEVKNDEYNIGELAIVGTWNQDAGFKQLSANDATTNSTPATGATCLDPENGEYPFFLLVFDPTYEHHYAYLCPAQRTNDGYKPLTRAEVDELKAYYPSEGFAELPEAYFDRATQGSTAEKNGINVGEWYSGIIKGVAFHSAGIEPGLLN